MPANRFYLNETLESGTRVQLSDVETHHMTRVMRVREGEKVEVVNGRWQLALGVAGSHGSIEIEKVTEQQKSSELVLYQALLKQPKLEILVEKGTELGISAFHFFGSVKSVRDRLSEKDLKRLRAATISAMKQCGRLDLPSIAVYSECPPLPETFYYGDVKGKRVSIEEKMVFVCGPESGFTEEEKVVLSKKGTCMSLGPNILRAETAPLAMAALHHFHQTPQK